MDAEQPAISSTDDAGVVDFKAAPIRARRIKFSYPQGSMNRHYVSDDLIMSHVVSMLSSVFPEGEDFFIRSVKYYKDEIAHATSSTATRATTPPVEQKASAARLVERSAAVSSSSSWRT